MIAGLFLSSCQQRTPDFTATLRSPDGRQTVTLRGFQPLGTLEGHIQLSFGDSGEPSAIFLRIKGGRIAWITSDTLAIVANELEFNGLASDYFPDGTMQNHVRLITCSKQDVDCLALEKRVEQASSVSNIARFPEG